MPPEDKKLPLHGNANFGSCESCNLMLLEEEEEEEQLPLFFGITKDEVQMFAHDPYWVRLRTILFTLFWVIWVTTLGTSVLIVATAPRCKSRPQLQWWQKNTMYEVNVLSFKDSNGDGKGDLKGIESKLDYFVDLGVETLWLSPIYKSPMVDFGYDISDFKDIDPIFGTMDDFKSLMRSLKEKNLKLVMDFVPNHSSDQCDWFQKSIKKEGQYTDYYIWRPAKGHDADGRPIPPNNWTARFGGSMWQWNDERQEFYLHQFAVQQPDLNFRNPLVIEEMKDVLKFWLDLGVDGFRMDAVAHMFEDEELRDEPVSGNSEFLPTDYFYYNHIYTANLPETRDVLAEFRKVLDVYAAETDSIDRLMMTEAYVPVDEAMAYYGDAARPIAHFPFNFMFLDNLRKDFTAQDLYNNVNAWMSKLPDGAWPNWLTGNHDTNRTATRLGKTTVDLMNIVVQLMKGTAITYYGEELGMTDTSLTWEQTVDPQGCNTGRERYQLYSRDPARTPMQWDSSKNAGFSDSDKTWLPVNPNYLTYNVEAEKAASKSHLKVYKALLTARRSQAIQNGEFDYRVLANGDVFAFTRILEGVPGYFVAVNPGMNSVVIDATQFSGVPLEADVHIKSVEFKAPKVNIGANIKTKSIPLGPKDAIVLTFAPLKVVAK